ncbi:MAG: hypothetical protein DDT40_01726 [candidate division WS2 bacterium]|uniref:UPF0033 domain-containing protein n=1 Tax=Psychracetigena formicireducens TaxID=2986056 RepID=A0A9E2BIL8_PSYF1|nr:hypothetical protein [Candidatus Psychracetigena formicireducens]MBT9146223.1 hypothetical protein [Candidatus Psychracetigena formicireducens]MBT9151530.1 hypothetical protein [Candidatus Psychracetigena formicireducens]
MKEIIDARGRSCPEPLFFTKRAVESGINLPFIVVVDNPSALENIKRYLNKAGLDCSVEEKDREYYISISKS